MSIRVLSPFFNGIFLLLLLRCMGSSYTLDMSSSSHIWFADIFSRSLHAAPQSVYSSLHGLWNVKTVNLKNVLIRHIIYVPNRKLYFRRMHISEEDVTSCLTSLLGCLKDASDVRSSKHHSRSSLKLGQSQSSPLQKRVLASALLHPSGGLPLQALLAIPVADPTLGSFHIFSAWKVFSQIPAPSFHNHNS